MSLFPVAVPKSPEESLAYRVDMLLRRAASTNLQVYLQIMALINENPAFKTEAGDFDPVAALTAFQLNTTTGLTGADLKQSAQFLKALINRFAPGKIEDAVLEAVVTFPAPQDAPPAA